MITINKSKLIRSTALFIVGYASKRTSTGNLVLTIDEFTTTDEEVEFFRKEENITELIEEIISYSAVAGVNYYGKTEEMDITLFTDYCWYDIDNDYYIPAHTPTQEELEDIFRKEDKND